jgi:hypothetical protein
MSTNCGLIGRETPRGLLVLTMSAAWNDCRGGPGVQVVLKVKEEKAAEGGGASHILRAMSLKKATYRKRELAVLGPGDVCGEAARPAQHISQQHLRLK